MATALVAVQVVTGEPVRRHVQNLMRVGCRKAQQGHLGQRVRTAGADGELPGLIGEIAYSGQTPVGLEMGVNARPAGPVGPPGVQRLP
jgi:hypothetical protein